MPKRYDVIVVGLGGMGSAAAYHLARRGRTVLGLEQFTAAHALGSSHGGTRIVRQAYFEDPAYVPLLLRAYDLWDEVRDLSGVELFTRTGGLYVGRPDTALVAGSRSAAREYGLAHDVLDATQIRDRYDFRVSDDEVAVLETHAGFARPELTVSTHLDLAARSGADLHFTEPVRSWSATRGGVRVETAAGDYEAGRLVLTAGAWAPSVVPDLGVPLEVERQVLFWFQPIEGAEAYEQFPIWIWEDPGGQQLYGFPAIDGPDGGTKLAFYRNGAATDPDHVDRHVRPDEVRFIQDYVQKRIPGLAATFLRAAACLYTNSPDLDFVVGPHPAHDNVVVAAGFSGHGFKFVPLMGEVLADLAERGTTRHPIGLFDPARFAG